MSLTITIPGAVNVTTGAMAPAVLTIGVGVPGATGPQGPAGPGVPVGGTAGQFLTKIDGTNYNTDWTTVNLAAYAPLNSPIFTGDPRGPTAALGDNDTSLATTAFVQQELLSGTANAKNLEVYVRNQTGSTIPAGSIVYINGATGNRPTVTLAQANNDANSAQTFGFTKTSIANNGFGYVIVRGELENINTSALTEGVQLYLSPTTAGTWTTTKPSAPQHLVYVGICVRAHPTQGVILVAVQNGYELPELHDVKITSPTNGQVLKYDSAQSLWVNGTDASGVAWGAITGTLTSQTDLNTALGLKYDASNPSGFITASALTPYLTSATAASTYQTISGMSDYLSKAGNLSGLASNSTARSNLGLGTISTVNDAPSDGSTYGRNNGAWVVAGGGSSPADALTTDEVNAIANASIPNYAAGTSSTLSYGGGLFTFNYPNPDPAVAGGYVSFISDSSYSFTIPSGSIANWEIRYPSGTGETIANLVSWFNSNYPGVGAIAYAGDDTQSIDSLGGLSSSAFVFQQNTVGSSDTFLISGYIKDYLDKMFFDTSGWQSMLVPVLGVSFPGVSKFLDLSTTFRQVTDNTFGTRIFANGAITSPLVNLPHGLAPGGPVNGDLWTTSSGLFVRINGATQTLGPGTDYRAYTTAGSSTWTKPAGAKWVEIIMFGGGGGGGSGGRFATTSIRTGAGGGAGGPILIAKVAASALGATETVVVGAGGTGGPSTTTDTTIGTGGNQGGSSSFSIFTAAGGGGGAGGGNIGTAPGGLATVGWVTGVTGASSTAGGTAPATNTAGASGGAAGVNSFVATGGGSGSGNIANTTTSNNGGTGGQKNASNTTSGTPLILGGTAGTTAGVAPTTGVAGGGLRGGGTGGGGGAYRTAQAGMAGAVGASPGGGGGGGSASDNGFASGAGGAGGVGAVYIITYC